MFLFMNRNLILYGLAIWMGATIALRVAGQYLLHPGHPVGTVALFAVSFILMAGLARRLCLATHLPPEQWAAGAISLALPTLLLDPFSSAFFPVVFPNMAAEVAGKFGGWMLICCAGAVAGVTVWKPKSA
jgi:hypothetical protein